MADEKLAQEKYMEFQMLAQQTQQIDKQMQALQQQVAELNATKEAVEDIGKSKIGKELLVPVASGIFVKGELKNNKELIVNVGSNTAVDKTIPETKKLLDEQLEEMGKFEKELESSKIKLSQQVEKIQQELQKIMK